MNKRTLLTGALMAGLVIVPGLTMAESGRPNKVDDNPSANDILEARGIDISDMSANNSTPSQSPRTVEDNPARIGNDDNGVHQSNGLHHSSDDSSDTAASNSSSTTISRDQAVAIAQSVFSNSVFEKVELEFEHGVQVYSVRFTDDARVDVSADDGSVLRVEQPEIENSSDDSSDFDDDNSGHDEDDDYNDEDHDDDDGRGRGRGGDED